MAAAGVMALGAFASPASAQINVLVQTSSQEVFANSVPLRGSGGGWNATITGAPTINFSNGSAGLPVVYCFDFHRQFTLGSQMNMTLLTFQQFTTLPNPPAVNPWQNISFADLNRMAALISGSEGSGYAVGDNPANRNLNTPIQNTIWDLGVASTPDSPALQPDLSDSWMILVDADDWAGNSDQKKGVQSFLVRIEKRSVVPEPSSFMLLVAGAGAMVAFRARRRNTVA
jgi:hypothetical protein